VDSDYLNKFKERSKKQFKLKKETEPLNWIRSR